MGQFLSIALVENSLAKTRDELLSFSNINQGDYKNMPEETIEENNILYSKAKPIAKKTSVILFPAFNQDFYNCSQYISEGLNTRVLTTHIYDGDVWFAYLFEKGKELTRFSSHPEVIGEKKEDWILNLTAIQESYGISEKAINNISRKNSDDFKNSDHLNTEEDLFDFLADLNYPVDKIKEYEKGYKNLIPKKELTRISRLFLTVDHLRKTKKYSPDLIRLDNELTNLFSDEIIFMESYKTCQTCGNNTISNEYYLNIDVLCIQLYGNCPVCKLEHKQLLMNHGFTHKMEDVRNYLDK